jgi:hypothetical protein
MVHDCEHIPETDHGSYGWVLASNDGEHCGKDGVKHEVIQCNLSAQRDMEEWQEHVSLVTSSDSSGYQSTTNAAQNSTLTARVLLSAIQQFVTLRWLLPITDSSPTMMSSEQTKTWKAVLQKRSPITGVEGHQDKTKAVGELPWPAQLNVRADELATEAINKQTHTRQAPTLIPLVQVRCI